MQVNMVAVLAATAVMFAVGAIWYMPIFGKVWGQIHGFDKLDKKTQDAMRAKMGPYYAVQMVVTTISAFVLAKLILMLPAESPYKLAAMVWFGFVMPAQVSGVIFGSSQIKWFGRKIAIMITESLAHLLAAAWVIHLIQG